jgi:hypothetical protein
MPDPKYKGRCIQLVTPSLDQAKRYEKLAEKAGTPLSKYLLSIIEEALADRSESPHAKISESMRAIAEENRKLKEDNRILSLLVEKYEKESKQREQAAFLDDGFQGERQISFEIAAVLRRGATHDYQLLEALGIGPEDKELIRAVHKQLEVLELHGLITKEKGGWKWIRK